MSLQNDTKNIEIGRDESFFGSKRISKDFNPRMARSGLRCKGCFRRADPLSGDQNEA